MPNTCRALLVLLLLLLFLLDTIQINIVQGKKLNFMKQTTLYRMTRRKEVVVSVDEGEVKDAVTT